MIFIRLSRPSSPIMSTVTRKIGTALEVTTISSQDSVMISGIEYRKWDMYFATYTGRVTHLPFPFNRLDVFDMQSASLEGIMTAAGGNLCYTAQCGSMSRTKAVLTQLGEPDISLWSSSGNTLKALM